MKQLLTILSLITVTSTAMAEYGVCPVKAEDVARKVSVALGMRKVDAMGTAHATEFDGVSKYIVYIGARTSIDRHVVTVNERTCRVLALKVDRANDY